MQDMKVSDPLETGC